MEVENVQARGPWVLVKEETPSRVSEGGIYLTEGNLYERLGHTVARVISVGKSYEETSKSGKKRTVLHDVKKGDRVVFRGHLKDANKVGDACFMHVQDIIGTLEEGAELGLSLPYNN